MSIGARLKEERQRLGWTQPAMADAGGVSKNSQIAYEQDGTEMKVSYLTGIAENGVDVMYVLSGKRVAAVGLSETENILVSQYRDFDVYVKDSLAVIFERLSMAKWKDRSFPRARETPRKRT